MQLFIATQCVGQHALMLQSVVFQIKLEVSTAFIIQFCSMYCDTCCTVLLFVACKMYASAINAAVPVPGAAKEHVGAVHDVVLPRLFVLTWTKMGIVDEGERSDEGPGSSRGNPHFPSNL